MSSKQCPLITCPLFTARKDLIICSLPETEDHINSFQVNLPSAHHLKTSGFCYFGWLETVA